MSNYIGTMCTASIVVPTITKCSTGKQLETSQSIIPTTNSAFSKVRAQNLHNQCKSNNTNFMHTVKMYTRHGWSLFLIVGVIVISSLNMEFVHYHLEWGSISRFSSRILDWPGLDFSLSLHSLYGLLLLK